MEKVCSALRLCFVFPRSPADWLNTPNLDFRINLLWRGHGGKPTTCRVRHGVRERHCPGDVTRGFCHSGPDQTYTCGRWLPVKAGRAPQMCWYFQKGNGIKCILAAEMAGIFASRWMIFFLTVSLDEPSVLFCPPPCHHHHHHHYLSQRSGNWSPLAKSGLLPVFVNEVLLKHRQVDLFTHHLWLLLDCKGGLEQL